MGPGLHAKLFADPAKQYLVAQEETLILRAELLYSLSLKLCFEKPASHLPISVASFVCNAALL